MTSIMPEVQAVNLKVRSETDHEFSHVDVSSDYGTLNLLFLSYIPFVPDEKEPDLYGIRDEFYSWNAWELGQAETQLNKHVKDGNLPSDDSVASRMIRNNYRSKAVSFFRAGNEPWLSHATNTSGQKIVKTTANKVNCAILEQLKALATEHKLQAQLRVILNAASSSINLEQGNKFHFSHIYMKYDDDSRRFLPVLSDTTFSIKKQDGESKSADDEIQVEIDLIMNSYNFDRTFWRNHRHEGEEAIRHGEAIYQQMALEFFVGKETSKSGARSLSTGTSFWGYFKLWRF